MDNTVLLLAGPAYAILFLALSMRFNRFPLIAIFFCAPILTDVSGGAGPVKFSLAEINILLSLVVLLLKGKWPRVDGIVGLSLFYIAAALFCSLPDWRSTSLVALVQIGIYLVVVVVAFSSLAHSAEDFRPCFYAFIVTCLVIAVSVIVFRTGFVYGMHKNNVGSSIAGGYLMALELTLQARRDRDRIIGYAVIAILCVGLLMTFSRGGWLSAIAGTMMILFLRRRFALMLRVGVVMGLLVAVCWSRLPDASKENAMKLSSSDWNIKVRYEDTQFAWNTFLENPLLGAGVGLRKEYDATNLVVLLLAESGVVGFTAFWILQFGVARLLWRTMHDLSQTDFSFSVVAIAAAVMTAKFAHGMVDHYWVRGTLTAAWGGVGMSIFVARDIRLRRLRLTLALHRHAPALLRASASPAPLPTPNLPS